MLNHEQKQVELNGVTIGIIKLSEEIVIPF